MKKVFLVFALLSYLQSSSQEVLDRELMVENDNDAYTLNLYRDQYYSNGVAIRYRHLINRDNLATNISKVIRSYDLNHRIYTPKHIWWTDTADMDRPYAGQISLAVSQEYYYKTGSYLKIKGELGWMGPALLTGDLQYNWHKAFGMTLPEGWDYEIGNAPIINVYGTYAQKIIEAKGLDIYSETNLALGTSFTHARQEIFLRIGNFKPINQSTQFNGVMGNTQDGDGIKEFYFFISPGVEYAAYNATIEGNLVGESSIYLEERVPWIYQTRAGLMASWTYFDFALLYYRRTKETPESIFHKYVGIRMNLRF